MKTQTFVFTILLFALTTVQTEAQTTQEAYVKASNPGFLDRFGSCEAISGNTMVATAIGEDSNATGVNGNQANNSSNGAGAAYVFVRDANGNWTQQAYLKASNTEPSTPQPPQPDNFGVSCAIDGDTIVIGAWREDSNATGVNGNQNNESAFNYGAVYVFVRNGTTWTQQAYLKASNTPVMDDGINNGDQFGTSVAIDGDTIVVGALFEDSGSQGVNGDENNEDVPNSGAAYVFVRDGTTWSQQAYLKQSNTSLTDALGARDSFGSSVAISGETIAVGSPGEDSGSAGIDGEQFNNDVTRAGAVYIFTRSGGTDWRQQAYIKGDVTDVDDVFGASVALDGDTLAVSVPLEDSNARGVNAPDAQLNNQSSAAGAVYIFERDSNEIWSRQAFIKASNTIGFFNVNLGSDNFGSSLAISGDRIVVGATGEDSDALGVNGDDMNDNKRESGAAFVFKRTGSTWSQEAYLKASNADRFDFLGTSVAISGNLIAVGSISENSDSPGVNGDQSDDSLSSAGAVYVFVTEDGGVVDTDGDGVEDALDNCTLLANPDQRDTNGDGFGNACDADLNNDNIVNVQDLGLLRTVFFDTGDSLDADFNGDGVVNVADLGIMRAAFFGAPGPSGTTPNR